MTLLERAQALADRTGTPCWVVTPREGQPYVTHRADQIAPAYSSLETCLPRHEFRSCWPPCAGMVS